MGMVTKYCLPIADFATAKPWQRSDDASYYTIFDVVNDQAGHPAEMASEPSLNETLYAYGCGNDGGMYYPQKSLWSFTPSIPVTATNLLVVLGGYFAHSPVGPTPRVCSWLLWDTTHAVVAQPFNITTPFTTGYLKYEWTLGNTNPLINGPWTPAAVNSLLMGVEATQDITYYTRCATAWFKVTYDLPPANRPRRAVAVLF